MQLQAVILVVKHHHREILRMKVNLQQVEFAGLIVPVQLEAVGSFLLAQVKNPLIPMAGFVGRPHRRRHFFSIPNTNCCCSTH